MELSLFPFGRTLEYPVRKVSPFWTLVTQFIVKLVRAALWKLVGGDRGEENLKWLIDQAESVEPIRIQIQGCFVELLEGFAIGFTKRRLQACSDGPNPERGIH